MQRADASAIRTLALQEGMRRLQEEGRLLVERGLTTATEVQRVTVGVE
ncbi:MAG: hypothetical protein Q8L55_03940 [Phycisphaerales bacterium]|nr:hypothetical protein [Phycisphaerales bacterium]